MTEYKYTPLEYQLDDARFGIQNKKWGILHEPGVGKTFSILIFLTYLYEKFGYQSIVVMPPILLDEWDKKFKAYFSSDIKFVLYEGSVKERAAKLPSLKTCGIAICSYAIFTKEHDAIVKAMPKLNAIICDESKFIKSTGSKAFKAVQKVSKKLEYLALMNGTPVTKTPLDLFSVIQLINPNIYVTEKNFLRHHAVYSAGPQGFPLIVGWKNLDKLNMLVERFCRRKLKKDVLDLPEKHLIIKSFKLDPKHQKTLKEFWDFGFLEIDEENLLFAQASALAHKIRQAAIDPSILGLDGVSRYFEMLDMTIDDLGTEQSIIYAHYHSTSDAIQRFLSNKGLTYATVDGRGTPKSKAKALEDFRSGKVQYLVGNAQSMGIGLDLQHCRNVIYFELDYAVDNFWQGMDRVHRPGQLRESRIFVFVADKTPSVALVKSIMDNIDYVSEILKGRQTHTSFFEDAITIEDTLKWNI